jgi:thioredoxin reductase (NADPH)
MTDYLVKQVEAVPNIDVRPRSQVVGAEGSHVLERLVVQDLDTGAQTSEEGVLFLLIGSEPRTAWLDGALDLDRWGFVLTGADLAAADGSRWPLDRPPALLETSTRGCSRSATSGTAR